TGKGRQERADGRCDDVRLRGPFPARRPTVHVFRPQPRRHADSHEAGFPMSVLTDVADAVTATLNAAVAGGAFTQTFTAVRGHLPEKDLTDYANLTVLVVVKGYEKTPLTRNKDQWNVSIDVGTIQHLPTGSTAEVDALLTLVDQMASAAVLE